MSDSERGGFEYIFYRRVLFAQQNTNKTCLPRGDVSRLGRPGPDCDSLVLGGSAPQAPLLGDEAGGQEGRQWGGGQGGPTRFTWCAQPPYLLVPSVAPAFGGKPSWCHHYFRSD